MPTDTNAAIDATLARLGLTISARFVPFSQSRNKAESHKSLNWVVTLQRNGRDILTTDYSAGMAHCPGDKAAKAPSAKPHEILTQYKEAVCAEECESGLPMAIDQWARGSENVFKPVPKAAPILPDARDVIYLLVMDSSVLDSGGFEDWAADFGYDADSRNAESIYRACLEIALKFRAAIGDAGMSELQTAFQDY